MLQCGANWDIGLTFASMVAIVFAIVEDCQT